jgi:subtilase family serine protease
MFYLSADSVLDAGDILLGHRSVPGLAVDAGSAGSTSLTIPPDTAAGFYYIIARADATDLIVEAHEINNTAGVPIVIGPDLIISSLTVPSGAEAGATINVKFVTGNAAGGGNAPASTTSFYLSSDRVLDGSDILLGSKAVPALAAGASSSGTLQLVIPLGTVPGTYYIIAMADGPELISEADETNNTIYYQITVR